jgi:hypothetical protein
MHGSLPRHAALSRAQRPLTFGALGRPTRLSASTSCGAPWARASATIGVGVSIGERPLGTDTSGRHTNCIIALRRSRYGLLAQAFGEL